MRFEIGGRQVAGSFESLLRGAMPEIQARTGIGGRVAIGDRVRLISTVSWTLDPLEATMFDIWSSVMDGLIPRHQSMYKDPIFELCGGSAIGEIIVGPWTVTEQYIIYDDVAIEHIIPVTMHCESSLPTFVFYDRATRRHLGSSDVVVKMLIICAMIKYGGHHLY